MLTAIAVLWTVALITWSIVLTAWSAVVVEFGPSALARVYQERSAHRLSREPVETNQVPAITALVNPADTDTTNETSDPDVDSNEIEHRVIQKECARLHSLNRLFLKDSLVQ